MRVLRIGERRVMRREPGGRLAQAVRALGCGTCRQHAAVLASTSPQACPRNMHGTEWVCGMLAGPQSRFTTMIGSLLRLRTMELRG